MGAFDGVITELQGFSLFSGFEREAIKQLCDSSRVIINRHHETVFNFGDEATAFGVVLSGAYKLSRPTAGGEDVIVYFSTPGDVVAAFIMTRPNPVYPVSVVAMGPSRLLKIPRAVYNSTWVRNPTLVTRMQMSLSGRIGLFQDQKALLRAPLSSKIAALLIGLLDKQPDQSDGYIPLPLTRKEIADSLGSSVESVIRVMSEWSKRGVFETTEKHIQILKPEILIQEFSSQTETT